jgi:hypothetical protein
MVTIYNYGGSDLEFNVSIVGDADNFALQFDGINDEVFIGYNSILDIVGDITICLWYKTESPRWGALVCNYDQFYPDNGYELCSSSLYEDGGFVYFECANDDVRDGFSTQSKFNDDKWHFVSAVLTPDGISRGRVFVDAIEQFGYYTDVTGGPIPSIGPTPDSPFKIGAAYSEAFFEGIIDEVKIWDRALSQQEIQANMYNNLTGSEPGLIGYWNFNEGSGGTANDKSQYSNTGTLSGGVRWVLSNAPIAPDWITVDPHNGIIPAKDSLDINITCDATGLSGDDYNTNVIVSHNDPGTSDIIIPVYLTVISGIEDPFIDKIPKTYVLFQNYPNPFNPITHIRFGLPKATDVKIDLYNILGQKVVTLFDAHKPAGYHVIDFDGNKFATGVYIYRIETDEFQDVKKMVLIK